MKSITSQFATNTNFFLRREGGNRGCVTVLVTGQYIILENMSMEYYAVRTTRSSVSSNQGLASHEHSLKISKKQQLIAHIQKEWKHRIQVCSRESSRAQLWDRLGVQEVENKCVHVCAACMYLSQPLVSKQLHHIDLEHVKLLIFHT